MSITSFSQSGSEPYPKLQSDGTTAIAPAQVASLNIFKTQCDFYAKELDATRKLVVQKTEEVALRDKEIKFGNDKFLLQKEITDSKVEQIDILKTQLRNERLKKTGGKILLYASIAANLFLLTKL